MPANRKAPNRPAPSRCARQDASFNDHKERNEKRHGVKERLSRADLQMLYGHDVDQQSEHAAYRSADMRLRDLCFERRLSNRRHQNGKESHVAGTDEENVPNFVLRRHPLHEHIGEHRKKVAARIHSECSIATLLPAAQSAFESAPRAARGSAAIPDRRAYARASPIER